MKLKAYNEMESNDSRASKFVDAFINQQKWSDVVGRLDRTYCTGRPSLVLHRRMATVCGAGEEEPRGEQAQPGRQLQRALQLRCLRQV